MQRPVFCYKDIFSLIWVFGHERGPWKIRVEGVGEGIDCVKEVDGETLDSKCFCCLYVSSSLSLKVTEFGDGAEILVLKQKEVNFERR